MNEMLTLLARWQLDADAVRQRMYRALTPRERWHAMWLLGRGWSAAQVADALGRDAHTIGHRIATFRQHGPAGPALGQTGGPPALDTAQQAALRAGVQAPPEAAASGRPTGVGGWCAPSSRSAAGGCSVPAVA